VGPREARTQVTAELIVGGARRLDSLGVVKTYRMQGRQAAQRVYLDLGAPGSCCSGQRLRFSGHASGRSRSATMATRFTSP